MTARVGKESARLEKRARYRGDLALPAFLALGMARRITAEAHDEDRLAIVVGQRNEQVFRIEVFLALQMHTPDEAHRLAAVQNQVTAGHPARQMFGRD